MDDATFNALWGHLDDLYKTRSKLGEGLLALNAGGIISFARRVQEDIDKFCDEVVSREKGRFEETASSSAHLRKEFGAEKFDAINADPNRRLPGR